MAVPCCARKSMNSVTRGDVSPYSPTTRPLTTSPKFSNLFCRGLVVTVITCVSGVCVFIECSDVVKVLVRYFFLLLLSRADRIEGRTVQVVPPCSIESFDVVEGFACNHEVRANHVLPPMFIEFFVLLGCLLARSLFESSDRLGICHRLEYLSIFNCKVRDPPYPT